MQATVTKSGLNVVNVGPRCGSTKVAAATVRSVMTLAVLSGG